jgi:hypothetical protein
MSGPICQSMSTSYTCIVCGGTTCSDHPEADRTGSNYCNRCEHMDPLAVPGTAPAVFTNGTIAGLREAGEI